MNIVKILQMAMMFYSLNKGQTAEAKKILKEGMDVINSVGVALKDNKITNDEKKAIVKELREFSKTSIDVIENIQLLSTLMCPLPFSFFTFFVKRLGSTDFNKIFNRVP